MYLMKTSNLLAELRFFSYLGHLCDSGVSSYGSVYLVAGFDLIETLEVQSQHPSKEVLECCQMLATTLRCPVLGTVHLLFCFANWITIKMLRNEPNSSVVV
jgi:hypothetical protein